MAATAFIRISQMYSVYNLALAGLRLIAGERYNIVPWYVWEIAAANAMIVGVAVFTVYISRGLDAVKAFYDELFFKLPIYAWVAFDVFVHFAPIVILGIPQTWWAYPVALTIFVVYLLIVKGRFRKIYGLDGHG